MHVAHELEVMKRGCRYFRYHDSRFDCVSDAGQMLEAEAVEG